MKHDLYGILPLLPYNYVNCILMMNIFLCDHLGQESIMRKCKKVVDFLHFIIMASCLDHIVTFFNDDLEFQYPHFL